MANANVCTLKKIVREMNVGESIYINAISCTSSMISFLKSAIIDGTLQPDPTEIDKIIKPESRTKFLSGDCIAPQMTYIKKKAGCISCIDS